ncbi:Chlorovirus glycoprotein repeat domain-containing protein [Acanthocystis turfacea Chlorella virus MN0810.1]|nr:Chlorovirus glycoprotein repeat domain-containing protein [Acanthocystis turfacea Chlorella virus MN0810.1]
MQLQGGNPVLNFDLADYFQYTRATNTLDLNIAANNVAKFDSQGNLTMLGNVAGRNFIGNGALLTGVTSTLPGTANIDIVGNVTAPGAVTASSLKANTTYYMQMQSGNPILNFDASDYFEYLRDANKLNLNIAGNTAASFDSQGNLIMLGNVEGSYFIGNGALLTGVTSTLPGTANIDIIGNVTAPGNVAAQYFLGDLIGDSVTSSVLRVNDTFYLQMQSNNSIIALDANDYFEYVRATNTLDLNIAGNNVAKFDSQGNLTMLGNVAGRYFIGNGALLTGVTSTLPTTADIDIRGNVTGVVANVGTGNFGNVNVTGQVTTVGNVSAAFFIGNGSQLTGIAQYVLPGAANIDITGNVTGETANIVSATFGDAYVNNDVSATGNVSAAFFIGNGSQLTGIAQYVLPETANIDITGNVTGETANIVSATFGDAYVNNDVSATGNVSAAFFIGNGSQLTGIAQYVLPGAANIDITGNVTGGVANVGTGNFGNVNVTGQVTATGNVSAAFFVGNVTGGVANVGTGNFGNVNVTGQVTATGNVSAAFFVGNVTGSVANVGTGNFGNVNVTGQVTATGNVSAAFFVGNGAQLVGVTATNLAANIGKMTGMYFVAMNGDDATADGSENKPFLTIQAAHDRALAEYPPANDGTISKQVQIYVCPGVYPGTSNISRYNTIIRGAGSFNARGQMTSIGPVNINCANAAYVYNNTVSLDNLFMNTGLVNTGSGYYTLNVDSCYVFGGIRANGVFTNTNPNSPVYINTSFLSSALPNMTYINANTGLVTITDTIVQTTANGITLPNCYLVNVGGNCVINFERCYMNSGASNNAAIYVSNGALPPGGAIKVTLTNSFVQNTLGTGLDFGTTNAVGFFVRNNLQVANGKNVFAGNGFAYQSGQLCTPGFSNTKAATFTLLPIPTF